ncbi:non-ribosomal peptide synthetase [Hamadaea tsunoensis]|uniref:non-ribosomal peptide synthetase n=1 Tax=Hamadaea tsunoensis TaxID=53368 RepID=UPI000412D256|nr:non-ribosomal peptide synthetase [Hamadaea tsunoensis]
MSAHELIAELGRRGVRLRVGTGTAGESLEVLAPPGAVTAELRDRLAGTRDELIAALRTTPGSDLDVVADPAGRHEPFPLTDIQHAYWVGRGRAVELGGVACYYFIELDGGELDAGRLAESLQRVVDRHDMLRAVVDADGTQRVLPGELRYDLPVADLRDGDATAVAAALDATRAAMSAQVLPADRWPLFDIRASLLPGGRTRLHVGLDILILDGLSLELLFRDWRAFYEDPGHRPEPLPLSYRDYVLAAERYRTSAAYESAREYWLDRLTELPPAPALPVAVPPAQIEHPEFTRRRAVLPTAVWHEIQRLGRRHGATPSGLLVTAYAEVLRRWSGQDALTLNLTLFSRPPLAGLADVIGDFTSVSLLAMSAEPAAPFGERAAAATRQLLQDLRHSAFSGVRGLRERARRLGGGPGAAMPVVFTSALGASPHESMAFFGDYVFGRTQTPQVWLDHQAGEDPAGLVLVWDAVEELFPAGLLDDMFDAYTALVASLAGPSTWDAPPVLALPAWQAAERAAANATAEDIPAAALGALVAASAAERPDAVAVVDAGGELTYRDLLDRARALAGSLVAAGARPGELVGVVAERGREQVVAVLAVALSGAAYLPVDPGWPQARRFEILRRGGARLAVTATDLAFPPEVRVLRTTDAADVPLPAVSPDDLAYVIFTSGSTGQPKGVMIDHRGAANTVQDINRRHGVGPADRVLALSSLTFDLSVYDVFGVLAAGGTVVVPDPHRAQDPAHWTDLVRDHQVTLWNSVPALMQLWIDQPDVEAGALRLALLSGDWIPVGLPDAVRARHPRTEVVSLGGATEGSIWSIAYPIGTVPPDWVRIPYGRALANQTMRVRSATGQDSPVWTPGEIEIEGVGVALGYWADEERTADRFRVDEATGRRVYRTGDLGRFLPGGDIEFLGRTDFQVKINGYRIELGEIEAALRRQAGVAEAVVTVGTNPATAHRALVAYAVPAAGSDDGADRADGGTDALADALDAGRRRAAQAAGSLAPELAGFAELWRAMAVAAPLAVARTLAQLGAYAQPGEASTAAGLASAHGIKPRFGGVLHRWLDLLAAEGLLSTEDGVTFRAAEPLSAEVLDARFGAALSPVGDGGEQSVLLGYFRASTDRLGAILRGEVGPLDLLLPGGSWDVTEALYAANPVSRVHNQVVAEVVASLVAARPGEVRVAEVGAGSGATTAEVLPALPDGRFRYLFTDVSTYFTDRARQRFGGHPALDFARWDIDHDPVVQGLPAATADVLIAANVLHDAADLAAALAHLRSALRPGGVLVLLEGTENSPVHLVTVGLIEGLARGAEGDLPFRSVPQWLDALAAAGFTGAAAIGPQGPAAAAMPQHVIVARAPGGRSRLDPGTLRAALADQLPEYLVPHHYVVLDALPLSANGKVDRSRLPAPWRDAEATRQVAAGDDVQRRLLEIWADALGRADFGVTDNFFELGGDSLHAVRILGRLRDEFGLHADADDGLQALFSNPTVAELAAAMGDLTTGNGG